MESVTWRRIGVIGDVHCEDVALERALNALHDVDAILCVGDIVDGLGDVERCIELLMNGRVLTVAGNHERWFLEGSMRHFDDATETMGIGYRDWLDGLPKTRRFETVAGTAILCHGIGEDDMSFLRPDTKGYGLQALDELRALMLDDSVQFMIGGHTHEMMVRGFEGLTVINAGTLHRNFDPGFITIDFEKRLVTMFGVEDEVTVRDTLPLP